MGVTVGQIRKAIEGLADDAPALLSTIEKGDIDLDEFLYLSIEGVIRQESSLLVAVAIESDGNDDEDDWDEDDEEFDEQAPCKSKDGHQWYHNPDFEPPYQCVVCDAYGMKCGECSGEGDIPSDRYSTAKRGYSRDCPACAGEGVKTVEITNAS